jgi:SEC-C motif-containing protein
LHDGSVRAGTAEQLMRSRYSAFAVGDEAYLLRTWHPSTRPAHVGLDRSRVWTGLEVLAAEGGVLTARTGTVEFRAHHRDGDDVGVQHEVSRFVREDAGWLYVGPLLR